MACCPAGVTAGQLISFKEHEKQPQKSALCFCLLPKKRASAGRRKTLITAQIRNRIDNHAGSYGYQQDIGGHAHITMP